jgi:signal transduction histidine kinase
VSGVCPGAVHVRADASGVHRVVQNLVDNALKFGKSRVVLNVEQREDGVLFSSWNDGPPIPETEAEHIFDEFYRGSNGRKAGGFGLGLASAKTLVQAMRGKIWYESPADGGSKFCVLLPKTEPLQNAEEHKG